MRFLIGFIIGALMSTAVAGGAKRDQLAQFSVTAPSPLVKCHLAPWRQSALLRDWVAQCHRYPGAWIRIHEPQGSRD